MNSQANAIEFRNRICMILQTYQSNKNLTKNVTATNVTKLNTKGVKAQWLVFRLEIGGLPVRCEFKPCKYKPNDDTKAATYG